MGQRGQQEGRNSKVKDIICSLKGDTSVDLKIEKQDSVMNLLIQVVKIQSKRKHCD